MGQNDLTVIHPENQKPVWIHTVSDPDDAKNCIAGLTKNKVLYVLSTDPSGNEPGLLCLYDGTTLYLFNDSVLAGLHQEIKALVRHSGLIGHEMKSLLIKLKSKFQLLPFILFDTWIASRTVAGNRNDLDQSLESCVHRYLGLNWNPVIAGNLNPKANHEALQGLAEPILLLPSLANVLIEKLNRIASYRKKNLGRFAGLIRERFGLTHQATLVECAFLPALVSMELTGVLLDKESATTKVKIDSDQLKVLIDQFKSTYSGVDPLIDQSVARHLQTDGFPLQANSNGTFSLKKHILLEAAAQHPFAASVLRIRDLKKKQEICNTLIDHLGKDGRIHAHFTPISPASARIACSDPNLPGVPRSKDLRQLLTAPEGKVFVISDFPQMEARIAAVIMEDPALYRIFSKKEDFYLETASLLSKDPQFKQRSPEEKKIWRNKAKSVALGLFFGMQSIGLKRSAKEKFGISIDLNEAEEFRNRFYRRFQGVTKFHENNHTQITQNGRAINYTLLGRRMVSYSTTQAANDPVQSSGAELLKLTVLCFREKLCRQKISVQLALLNQDEIMAETEEKEGDLVKKALAESMVEACRSLCVPLSMEEVNVKICKNWGEAK